MNKFFDLIKMDLNALFVYIFMIFIISSIMYISYLLSQSIIQYLDTKRNKIEHEIRNIQTTEHLLVMKDYENRLDYSDHVLKHVRELVSTMSNIRFKTFLDKYETSKITQEHVKKLIEDIAVSVNESIDYSNINFNNTIFTKEYLNKYIIEITMYLVKDLVNESILDLI